jgi:putative nucleotidyltransferase with HDIG domain
MAQEQWMTNAAIGSEQPADESPLVRSARAAAFRLLMANPERLRHSAAVAARAHSLADAVPDDQRDLLVAAAWLHDVGYAEALRDTGFHPLDGARFLRSARWESRVCDLVAHHSGSRFLALLRGLESQLAEFDWAQDPVSDALTIADQTVGPNGRPLSLEDRMQDMLDRHGPDSPNARAHPQRRAYFRAAFERVSSRLADSGSGSVQGEAVRV